MSSGIIALSRNGKADERETRCASTAEWGGGVLHATDVKHSMTPANVDTSLDGCCYRSQQPLIIIYSCLSASDTVQFTTTAFRIKSRPV